ncbi:MAG: heme-binding protein [Pseudomonadota bacterium]
MTEKLSLAAANAMIEKAFEKGAELRLKPLSVVVLDAGGHVIAFQRQDGASNLRFKMAHGKAYGTLALGIGSRAIYERAQEQAYFINAVNAIADGALVPVPGGVLIKTASGDVLGAVGVTGDTSDHDEACAVAAIEAGGFTAVP